MHYYSIAGLNVQMECSGRTFDQALPYLRASCNHTDITLSAQRISEYKNSIRSRFPNTTDDSLDYIASGALFYRDLLLLDGMMLHSSAVIVDDRAYLFTADSGTGKSTHTALWLKYFGNRAKILNDDKPAIRFENDRWYAYGTPWSGKNDISLNLRAEIAGIAVLERAQENHIEQFSGIQALHAILKQVNRPPAMEHRIKLMELLDKLITTVAIWKLQCNMDPEAAIIAYEAMSSGKGDLE